MERGDHDSSYRALSSRSAHTVNHSTIKALDDDFDICRATETSPLAEFHSTDSPLSYSLLCNGILANDNGDSAAADDVENPGSLALGLSQITPPLFIRTAGQNRGGRAGINRRRLQVPPETEASLLCGSVRHRTLPLTGEAVHDSSPLRSAKLQMLIC